MEIINTNYEECEGLEVVSRFVNLLGSSASQVSLEGDGGGLKGCLSNALGDSDVVCFLPSFRVVEEPKEKVKDRKIAEPTPGAIRSIHDALGSSMRSVFHLSTNEPKEGASVVVDDNGSEGDRETEFLDKFTSGTIDEAPLALLRNLQDAFRQYSRSRLDEWKELLLRHPSHEAHKLVKLLTYHKMIAGCRGNTRMYVVGLLDEEQKSRDCDMGMHSETDFITTNKDGRMHTRHSGLAFRLCVEFFVKIRHGARTFATSSFTLSFDTLGTVRYSLNAANGLLECASFECDQRELLQEVKTKAHALVLNAIGFQAAESVRWTRTLLSDLWEGNRLMRDEDTLSDSISVLTSTSCVSSLTNGNSSVDSCAPTDPETCVKSWKRSRRPLSRCLVPKNITTTGSEEDGSQRREWHHSLVYQLFAFVFLFTISFQVMKAKDFCHSLFQNNLNSPLLEVFHSSVREEVFVPREPLQSSPRGVSFHRVITNFPQNSEFLLNFDKEDSYCEAIDEYGANDCHFNWRDEVIGNFSTAIPQQLDENSSVQADLILEGHIHYRLNCALCGQPCKNELPLIHFVYSLPMPPCPVDLSNHSQDFHYQLWNHSPTDGLVSVSVEGNAIVYSSPGEKLAEFEVNGAIR